MQYEILCRGKERGPGGSLLKRENIGDIESALNILEIVVEDGSCEDSDGCVVIFVNVHKKVSEAKIRS